MRIPGLLLLLLLSTAPAPLRGGAAVDDDPVTDVVRAKVPEHEHDIVEAFRIMPDDKYGFRPTPELMTFSELAMHIAGANFYYCRTLAGPDAPRHSLAKTTAPKADLLKVLQESFTFCNGVVRESHDANLAESLALPGTPDTMTRARILIELVSGMDHHYGQAASYLRLNGLVPPTARAPKAPISARERQP